MSQSAFKDSLRELGTIFHTQDLILKLGRKQFGEPTRPQVARLLRIVDLDRLDRIAEKAFTAKSWDGLLRTQ
jgi:hypothetical protein